MKMVQHFKQKQQIIFMETVTAAEAVYPQFTSCPGDSH
jgi:hypothetical protein